MSRKAVKLETMDVYKAVIIQWAISEDIGMQKRGKLISPINMYIITIKH